MLPINRHVDLADTSVVPRALIKTVPAYAQRMRAGWRPAAWRSLNPASILREAAAPAQVVVNGAAAGGGTVQASLAAGGEQVVRWHVPLNVGDRLLRTRVRFGSDAPFETWIERATAPGSSSDGQLEIVTSQMLDVPEQRVANFPALRDAAVDLYGAGIARPVAEWEFYRIAARFRVDQALAAAVRPTLTYVVAISMLVDHPI